ncbi:hypothetical protein [Hydrogenibacillus sp. N12]|uniref:hypothetical protein n=1 Tax=Hydrogenibacillus sp. N12 TaxID=2866627 RepID=UPI001C7CEBFB|nr:hypothetical protein [Hydrogenibacillus sp. N12]QZA33648.1 hypothetical protein K2M58_03725 [Hydrogenibacillus sp. N12]
MRTPRDEVFRRASFSHIAHFILVTSIILYDAFIPAGERPLLRFFIVFAFVAGMLIGFVVESPRKRRSDVFFDVGLVLYVIALLLAMKLLGVHGRGVISLEDPYFGSSSC